MKINKKIYIYFFITFLLVSFSVAYAAVAKNNWKAKVDNGGGVGEDKKMKTDKESSVQKDVSMTEDASTQAEVEQGAADQAETKAATTLETGADISSTKDSGYLWHRNISTTYFWAGEEAGKDNGNISNLPSAWDEDWVKHFGGIDTPNKRSGFYPANFTPKENPFYFALPYNDFNEKGNQKNDKEALAIWATDEKLSADDSMCKNKWIKIVKDGKTAYAQWEDVGPFGEDDKAYVFGGATPKSKENSHAGLDVSPAVHDYLGLSDMDKSDWQFVDAADVPDGPWKKIVTTSQTFWR